MSKSETGHTKFNWSRTLCLKCQQPVYCTRGGTWFHALTGSAGCSIKAGRVIAYSPEMTAEPDLKSHPLIVEAVNSHAALMEAARALRTVLDSAHPNKIEHPRMYAAWGIGDAALAELEKAGIL